MPSVGPRSFFEELVGGCYKLLVGAAALYLAVRLIEAVWAVALTILGVTGFITVTVMVLRGRRRGW